MDGGANDVLKNTFYCRTKLGLQNKYELKEHIKLVMNYMKAILKVDSNTSFVYIIPNHIKNDNLTSFCYLVEAYIKADSTLKSKVTFIETNTYVSKPEIQKDTLHIKESAYISITTAIAELPCMQITQ